MDSSRPAAIAALWDTDSATGDVDKSDAGAALPTPGAAAPGALGGEAESLEEGGLAALTGHARDTASGRNVTVLPSVESSGEKIQLRPRSETRYQRVRKLGAGAMGEVSLVRDNDIGRTVALKQLVRRTQSADGVARFIEEIRTIGQLEHPNIVPNHDVGVDEEGQLFFVMKHIDGETLETLITKLAAGDPEYLARYPIDVRVELFLGLLRALQFAHSHGIIHRGARSLLPVEKSSEERSAERVRKLEGRPLGPREPLAAPVNGV